MEAPMSATVASPESGLTLALRVAALIALTALAVLLTFVPVSSNDFWLQAKIGEMIVENHAIPQTVLFPFSWVQANRFNAHEWLPSIVFHGVERALGEDHLLFAQGAAGLLLFGLSSILAVRLSRSFALGLILAIFAMVVANYRFHLRPEIFALVFFVLLLHVFTLYSVRKDWRILLWSLPIAVLWANSHGSFLVGPVLALIFAAGEAAESFRNGEAGFRQRIRATAAAGAPYAVVALAMALCSLANPLGIELLHFALTLSASEVTKAFVDEWQPTLSLGFVHRWPFRLFIAAVVGTLAVLAASRRRLTVTDLLIVTAFGFLAFQRTRFIVFFAYAAMTVCARLLGEMRLRAGAERLRLAIATLVGGIGVGLAMQFGNVWGAFPYIAPSSNFTEPMINRLARPEMHGNVFNSYELGAELIYRAYPRLRPSMDSRIDSYGDAYFLLQTQMLVDEPLLKEFIKDFDIRYMLLSRRDFDLVKQMKGLQDTWHADFMDHKAVLLMRNAAAPSSGASAPPGTAAQR
jgi:hypothetical protein